MTRDERIRQLLNEARNLPRDLRSRCERLFEGRHTQSDQMIIAAAMMKLLDCAERMDLPEITAT